MLLLQLLVERVEQAEQEFSIYYFYIQLARIINIGKSCSSCSKNSIIYQKTSYNDIESKNHTSFDKKCGDSIDYMT